MAKRLRESRAPDAPSLHFRAHPSSSPVLAPERAPQRSSQPGHSLAHIMIQPKLTVNAPGDIYEQEADRVARQVAERLTAPRSVQRAPIAPQPRVQPPLIGSVAPPVQRADLPGAVAAPIEVETAIQAARGSGQALPADVRTPMEQAFGHSFANVRVHADAHADRLNQAIQARAFTTGADIFFRKGEYWPASRAGQELLAHELTHVVQQRDRIAQQASHPGSEGTEATGATQSAQLNRSLTQPPQMIQRHSRLRATDAGWTTFLLNALLEKQPHMWDISDAQDMALSSANPHVLYLGENVPFANQVGVFDPADTVSGLLFSTLHRVVVNPLLQNNPIDCGMTARKIIFAINNNPAFLAGVDPETHNYSLQGVPGLFVNNPAAIAPPIFGNTGVAAQAAVGQAYVIVPDPAHNPSTMAFHWGAVIAKSGNNVVTMEHFAAGNAVQHANFQQTGWRFMMYTEGHAQNSFHALWAPGFTNANSGAGYPLTFVAQY